MSGPSRDELQQAELDGTASAADSARLHSLLEQEPELAARFEALRRASGELSRAERLEPPPDLLEGVMAAVRERPGAPAPRPGWLAALRALFAPVPLAACAAALVVGVVLGALLPAGFGGSPAEREQLSGTVLPHGRLGGPGGDQPVPLRAAGVTGEASARLEGEVLVVDVSLDTRQPVEIRIALDGGEAWPRSGGRPGPAGPEAAGSREVRLSHPAGEGRYRVALEVGPRPEGTVRLRLGESGDWALPIGGRGR